MFKLLDGERAIGVKLTESFAMWPGASVCGLYFSHPDSYYFGVGKIERDQVEDYAKRKGETFAAMEKWLAPILNYDPLALGAQGRGVVTPPPSSRSPARRTAPLRALSDRGRSGRRSGCRAAGRSRSSPAR